MIRGGMKTLQAQKETPEMNVSRAVDTPSAQVFCSTPSELGVTAN